MAAGMATGKAWFKVPSAIKFNLTGELPKWVSGKDVILHIIGMIGVDGALYKSMEFTGDGIGSLSMDDRFTIANMAIEAGGKNGIFPVDAKAIAYMEEHSKREFKIYEADEDAEYDETYTIDLSTLKPTVAFPHLPENTKTIDEVGDIAVQQAVIGSCTNGRLDDLRIAAKVLEGKKVAKGVRCIVIPATQKIYLQAMEEGLLKTFIEAGAIVSTPTCGPCLGGYMGILAEGERCISTTNRNFVGRMGHVESERAPGGYGPDGAVPPPAQRDKGGAVNVAGWNHSGRRAAALSGGPGGAPGRAGAAAGGDRTPPAAGGGDRPGAPGGRGPAAAGRL